MAEGGGVLEAAAGSLEGGGVPKAAGRSSGGGGLMEASRNLGEADVLEETAGSPKGGSVLEAAGQRRRPGDRRACGGGGRRLQGESAARGEELPPSSRSGPREAATGQTEGGGEAQGKWW